MLEIVRGEVRNVTATEELIRALRAAQIDGVLYLGYPILPTSDSKYTIQALLISEKHGLVVFDFKEDRDTAETIRERQDRIFYLMEGNLKKFEMLRLGRQLAVEPIVITFSPSIDNNTCEHFEDTEEYLVASPDSLIETLENCRNSDKEKYYLHLSSVIERATNLRPPKKRENIKENSSKGSIIKTIEREIANLDKWQKRAAIEVPNGPQRIRGLAGSGKTIVLAWKAAYLHVSHPEWNIVVTFHTRSLKQQFLELIERFVFEHIADKPDWSRLKVLHSWGSAYEPGVYSEIAEAGNALAMNYAAAKQAFGVSRAFEGACERTEQQIDKKTFRPIYDAVLIDEAQDLPIHFFRLVYQATSDPKRIIWAYDELQSLQETQMPTTEEIFGRDTNGKPLVTLNNVDNEPRRDIVLPICYRNTPWALTVAHALGLGIYRAVGLVQMFDEPSLWNDLGYSAISGDLDFDEDVVLERKEGASPAYFKQLLLPEEAVVSKCFETEAAQYEWVADEIQKNIHNDELDPDDVLVVFPDAMSTSQQFGKLRDFLHARDLEIVLAGVTGSRDLFRYENSITAASIFRAKGNEAPMVYLVNADFCAQGAEMITLRNILFTAVTRSRAWLRICGVGERMNLLMEEIYKVISNKYRLAFHIPSREELKRIRLINRDMTRQEKNKILKAKKDIESIVDLLKSGVVTTEIFPELQDLLREVEKSMYEREKCPPEE